MPTLSSRRWTPVMKFYFDMSIGHTQVFPLKKWYRELPASLRHETDDLEILALLSRRPCTVHGISTGLGMNPGEVAKRLHCLSQRGDFIVVRSSDMVFYEKAGPLSQIK
jgi:hypothetical protein